MRDNSFLCHYSLELVKTLSKGTNLQDLVDLGYQMLGNPFTLTDFGIKLLASTGKTKVTDDPVWNELNTNNYFIFQTYSYYAKSSLFEEIMENEQPFYWLDPYCKYPRIIGKIRIDNKDVAFLAACAHNRDFKEEDKEIVSILCDAFSVELQKSKYNYLAQSLQPQSFLFDLLNGKPENERIIEERLKVLGLKLKRKLFVLSLDTQNLDVSKSTHPYLRREIENKLPNAKAVIFDNNIVTLASCENEIHFMENELKNLRDFIEANNLQAGISRSFTNLTGVREHYLESIKALKLGDHLKKEAHFFRYTNYLIYDVIDSYGANGKCRKLLHQSLLELIEYDKKNNSEFSRTLCTYICNFKNIKDSAASLNIHRNTMFHRIEKIENLMNIDLNDSDILFQLYLSFKILEFLKISLP